MRPRRAISPIAATATTVLSMRSKAHLGVDSRTKLIQPVIVVQTLTDSAVTIAASYAAKAYGIKTGALVRERGGSAPRSSRRRFTDGVLAHVRTPGGPTSPAQPLFRLTPVFPDFMSLPRLNPVEPPWYGTVCPVVGEGWHREVSPYPDQSARCRAERLQAAFQEPGSLKLRRSRGRYQVSLSERAPPACPGSLDLLAKPQGPLDSHKSTQDRLQRLVLITTVLL